ncbi:MAG: hypothetical protein U5J63_00965 [Fodinibius sp.]|nr:hypothetical protein [Fodinibius sp.]
MAGLAVLLLMLAIVPFQVLGQNSGTSQTQSSSYQLLPAPDLWYNSVDGVRVGARVLGQVPNSFGDGPHRLNAGLWLGTKFPENPVSYYLKFTEPIPAISDFGSEASISLQTSYRTGFQSHGVSFDKRWQTGFNEMNYKELSVEFRAEHRFDSDYLLYEQLWQDQWLYLVSATFDYTDENVMGRYHLSWSADANIAGSAENFMRSRISYQQQVKLSDSFTLYSRLFTGLAGDNTAPEYLFAHSYRSASVLDESGAHACSRHDSPQLDGERKYSGDRRSGSARLPAAGH